MKKAVIYLVLFSLTLHCAERLGLLSYLYEQRHKIAFSVGLIEEIPISLCNSDYDFEKGLKIHAPVTDHSLPPIFAAREITLFWTDVNNGAVNHALALISTVANCPYTVSDYSDPEIPIFQPPRV